MRGGCQDFPSKISCLTVPKNAVVGHFSHSLFSGIEKVWIRGGGRRKGVSQFSVENFCFTMPKTFVGEHFCAVFQKNSGSKKYMDKSGGGGIKIFRRSFFVSQCRKTP